MVRLQQDMTDHRTELRLRMQTPDSGLQTDSGPWTPEEENLVIPKSGRPHDRYVTTGENSGRAAAGHCRLPCGAQTQYDNTPAVSTRYWDSVQTTVEAPAPTPEVPAVEKLLQRLVTDTQSRPLPVVNPPAPTELEQSMRPFLAEQRRRWRWR